MTKIAQKRIRKAVIPAAGLGTRFLPATKAVPKEMLPIIDIPMIQYNIQEAVDSGIEEIIIVTSRNKSCIEDHFDYNYELEDILQKRGKTELCRLSKSIAEMCRIVSIRQMNPLGLGHAVLTAANLVGDEPFAVLLGDDIVDGSPPCTKQLMDLFYETGKSVVGVMSIPKSDTFKYGIVDPLKHVDGRCFEVKGVVEKPDPSRAPSQFAIPGRYILTPSVFDHLRVVKPGAGGEIQLTDALEVLAKEGNLLAYEFEGDRYDAGDHLGYIEATIAYSLKRDNLREGVKALLRKYTS